MQPDNIFLLEIRFLIVDNMENIKEMTVKEFVDAGILHEMNRQFLHPIGLAIDVSVENNELKLGRIWDYREDPQGIVFDKIDNNTLIVFKNFQKTKHKVRKKTMGFIVQEENCNKHVNNTTLPLLLILMVFLLIFFSICSNM